MIKLPTTEETTRTYTLNDTQVSFELIELDELHKSSAEIARNNKEDFYDVFNRLLKNAKGLTLSKAAIYLILIKKNSDFETLKKTSSSSEPSLKPLDSLVVSPSEISN
jgi:hypothetical protein